MYYSITGKVAFYEENRVVLECGDIGFDIAVSGNTLFSVNSKAAQGLTVTLFTHLQVQDDAIKLYGFATKEEKSMFEKLITISGVGCRMALQILSGIDLGALAASIALGDVKQLSKIKGIGKKTAERIILELKEKVADDDTFTGDFVMQATGDTLSSDAVFALCSLGIGKSDAARAVAAARAKTDKLEDIIAQALRSFDR